MSNCQDLVVRCPRCGKRGRWFSSQWGPFCSERCKLIDLGQWFNEEHKISRELKPKDFEDIEDLPMTDSPDGHA